MDDIAALATRYRLSADEYFRMGEAGVFAREQRVELIEGDIIDMAPIGQEHEAVVDQLAEALFLASARQAIVRTQSSLRLGRWNAPQPDIAVLRRRADFYAGGERAGAADALLVIEVADSSLAYDRAVKVPLYARAGVPEVWIVDLRARAVKVYRGPAGDGYGEVVTRVAGETVALAAAAEIVVRLELIFGEVSGPAP